MEENKEAFESLSKLQLLLSKKAEGKSSFFDQAWHEQFLLLLARYQTAINDFQTRLDQAKTKLDEYEKKQKEKVEEESLRRLAIAYARYGLREEEE